MASIGNLDNFFQEEGKITDYSWLDIDPKDYVNAPFEETPAYIALPKLEEAWKHLEERNINLIPTKDHISVTPNPHALLLQQQESARLVNQIKKQIMSGRTGKDLLDMLLRGLSSEFINNNLDSLKDVAQEQGLLGNVYIEPNVFSNCEEGSQFLEKRAKTAKYVLAMPSCKECIHNSNGRCSLYKKNITAQVNYDENLFSFYSKHFSNILKKEIKISSKEDLRKAFLIKEPKEVIVASNKPSMLENEEPTLEQKKEEFKKNFEELKDVLTNIDKEKIAKNINTLIIKGSSNKEVNNYIKFKYASEYKENSEYFSNLLKKQGSLGKIYVLASTLPGNSCLESAQMLKTIPNAQYLLLDKKPYCQCQQNSSQHRCRNLNKVLIDNLKDIDKKAWVEEFKKYPVEIVNKFSEVFAKNNEEGLRLAFLENELLNKNLIVKAEESYDLQGNLYEQEYIPVKAKAVSINSDKVILALKKGQTLKDITAFCKRNGCSNQDIAQSINTALANIDSINKYQMNISVDVPKDLRVVSSGKDINLDLRSNLIIMPEFAKKSYNAPVDNMSETMNLRAPDLQVNFKKSEDLEITGLSEISF